ncbi:hypothetical protein ABIB42_001073 [Massilia sp. UYP32]|uniref:hypothetical protein n=1 Tax=Massilia sp. UYP32 TaxID=1756386 RepID=UPI003D1EFB1B
MEHFVTRWKALPATVRRNVVILGAVGCLAALYGLSNDDSDLTNLPGSNDVHYVRAGGALCQNLGYAVMHARAKDINGYVLVDGCQRVGGSIEVEMLDREITDGGEVFKVGNSGGTAWVVADDLR